MSIQFDLPGLPDRRLSEREIDQIRAELPPLNIDWFQAPSQDKTRLEAEVAQLDALLGRLLAHTFRLRQENRELRAENYWLRTDGSEKYPSDDDLMAGDFSVN